MLVAGKKEAVVALVLEDIGSSLTYSCAEIKEAIIYLGWGTRTSKDFLRADATTTTISRGKTDHKRRCIAIYLSKMPDDVQQQFLECELQLLIHLESLLNGMLK